MRIPWANPKTEPILFRADSLSNRFLKDVLPSGSWAGKPAVIVGGGPSLLDFDWALLEGYLSIGINRAYEYFDPTILFSMDTRFLNWIYERRYGQAVLDKFNEFRGLKVWLCTYTVRLPGDIYVIPVYRDYEIGERAFPDRLEEGLGHGQNSGYGALNLAHALGANPIYLLGFDMSFEPGSQRTHHHDGHPLCNPACAFDDLFIPAFRRAARILSSRKVEVFNLNPLSRFKGFKFGASELLKRKNSK